MQQSGCIDVTVTSHVRPSDWWRRRDEDYGDAVIRHKAVEGLFVRRSTAQRYTFRPFVWLRSVGRKVTSIFLHSQRQTGILPQYQSNSTTKASVHPDTALSSLQRASFLMACMHRTKHHVNVVQDRIEAVTSDRQLFSFLRSQLRQHRRQFKGFMSMSQVQRIFFVKVSL